MSRVIEEVRPCFHCIGQHYGKVKVDPEDSPADRPLTVVWHVRVGDVELHQPGGPFYDKVYKSLEQALLPRGKSIQNVVICANGHPEYAQFIQSVLPNVTLLDLDAKQSIMHMMNCDILVGSGSSFPLVALMFSYKPFYLHHEPKHGFHNGIVYLTDGPFLYKDGTIDVHPFSLSFMIERHLKIHREEKYVIADIE